MPSTAPSPAATSTAGASNGGAPTASGGGGGAPVDPVPALPPGDVLFQPPGGGFAEGVTVTLSLASGQAPIHYTVDGSVPTAESPVYEGPLALADTTMLRAATVFDGAIFGVFAQTYLILEADVAAFSSDLPIVVLERHGDIPIDPQAEDLRPSSALTFEPDDTGRAVLLGPASSASRAGVKVRGASSRRFAQKSYSVELWEASSDEDRKAVWLGMPEESDFALVAPSQMDRSLMRTMLPMELSRAIGSYAPRTRFVEVFVVDREGSRALSYGDYVGVYTATERVKRDPNRVDITKLELTDAAEPAVTGGYLVRIDHESEDFEAGGVYFQWEYPEAVEMLSDERTAQRDYFVGYMNQFFEALYDDGDYASFIDVPKWIDHNLLVALTKNVDGLRLSSYFHKDREGPLVAGPIWDFDRSQGTPHDERATRADEWADGDATHPLTELFWADLFARPEFEEAYWARFEELAETDFSVDSILARIDAYEAELLEARERHFERWAEDLPPEGGPDGEVELLRDFYRERVPWLLEQRP